MGDFIKYIDWYKTQNKDVKGGKASTQSAKNKASVKSKKATPKRSVSKGSKKTK